MISGLFGIMGLVFLVLAIVIYFKKNLRMIPGITEKKIKKIKNKDVLVKDYCISLGIMSASCLITALFFIFMPQYGMIIGLISILGSFYYLNRVVGKIDEKISQKVY